MAVEMLPDSAVLHHSLAEAHTLNGRKEQAERSYRKTLELDPEKRNAQRKLAGLDRYLYEARHETRILNQHVPGTQTGLMGPYLGQPLPGTEPEVFAPGLISTRGGFEFSCSFSPDGQEFYFNRGFNIWVSRWEDEGWTAPEKADFNTPHLNHEPHITADGQRLFFGSGRPRPGKQERAYGIWVLDRIAGGWGNPRYHASGMYVTTAANGNLYLTDIFEKAGGGIVVSRLAKGEYGPFERLGGGVNQPAPAAHPCIAADESFIMFDSARPDALGGEGDDDFYVSFRQGDGSWGEAVHLAEISTPGSDMTASLSPDGKYLFFHSNRDIYWVSAEILRQVQSRQP
jgi:hypothetical protein